MTTDRDRAASSDARGASAGRLAAWLSGAPLAPGSRILALGAHARPIADALRAAGHEVTDGDDGDLPSEPDAGAWDAIVAAGFLERQRWDRWALQRMHAALRDRGSLLLVAPNLFRLTAIVRPGYVAEKLAKRVPAFATGFRRPGTAAPATGDRSYAAGVLRATLERLGFEVVGGGSPPWSAADAWLPPALRTRHVVRAIRRPSVFGVDPARPFPDAHAHRARFEQRQRGYVKVREAWARRHAARNAGDGPARPFEPLDYASARVLVLAPHPDDELIGCGGTMLRLMRAGARVTVLYATDGSASAALERETESRRRAVRLEEAAAVARAAGFEMIPWGEDNRAFIATRDLVERLRATLRTLAPAAIFTPFVTDDHPDHVTLNRILAGALETDASPSSEVFGYEVWGIVPANRYCDVTDETRAVDRLLHLYPTAMRVDDFVHLRADRGYAHATALAGRPGFVEAFHAASPATHRALVADLIR